MKTRSLSLLAASFFLAPCSHAVTVAWNSNLSFFGLYENGSSFATLYTTMHAMTFRVDTPSTLTLSASLRFNYGIVAVVFTGDLDTVPLGDLNGVGVVASRTVGSRTYTGMLGVGDYILVVRADESDWDSYDGMQPIFPTIGYSFSRIGYSVSLSGNFTPLARYEGQQNRTYIVTQLPEPGPVGLVAGTGCAWALRRGRRKFLKTRAS